MDPWITILARGRVVGYTTHPWGHVEPLPVDVPCDDPLVTTCRNMGVPVYPVYEHNDLAGAA